MIHPIHVGFLVLIIRLKQVESRRVVLRGTKNVLEPSKPVFGNLQVVLEIFDGVPNDGRGGLRFEFDFGVQVNQTVNAFDDVSAFFGGVLFVLFGELRQTLTCENARMNQMIVRLL